MPFFTPFLVISVKMTRFSLLTSTPKSSARCQEMASPSRSGSVASRTLSLFLAAAFSFLIRSSLPLMFSYTGAKSWSTSTPSLLLGRSRMWPMEAITSYPSPRYF